MGAKRLVFVVVFNKRGFMHITDTGCLCGYVGNCWMLCVWLRYPAVQSVATLWDRNRFQRPSKCSIFDNWCTRRAMNYKKQRNENGSRFMRLVSCLHSSVVHVTSLYISTGIANTTKIQRKVMIPYLSAVLSIIKCKEWWHHFIKHKHFILYFTL